MTTSARRKTRNSPLSSVSMRYSSSVQSAYLFSTISLPFSLEYSSIARKFDENVGKRDSSTVLPYSLHQSMYADRTRASRTSEVSMAPPSVSYPSMASMASSSSSMLFMPSCLASFLLALSCYIFLASGAL
jgi:hypothetical protein